MTAISKYITALDPTKFGGHQTDYEKQSAIIIAEGSKRIACAREKEANIEELFFELLEDFGKARQRIAKEHGTGEGEKFGKKRTDITVGDWSAITMQGAYAKYGQKAKEMLKPLLEKMESDHQTFSFPKNSDFPRISQIEIEILSQAELDERKWTTIPDKEKELCAPKSLLKPIEEFTLEDHQQLHSLLGSLKKTDKPLYNRYIMSSKLHDLTTLFPTPSLTELPTPETIHKVKHMRTHIVRVIFKEEIEGKLYHMCEHLTWLYRGGFEKPTDKMVRDATVIIYHTDKYNLDVALSDLAKIFKRAVLCNPDTDHKSFMRHMAEFRKVLSITMPFCRGTSAIEDWFEQSIFGSYNRTVTYKPEHYISLETLVQPKVTQFIEDYVSERFFTVKAQ